ncbi:MAG: hypothetical protein LBJ77_04215, partial [Holosporales bacterium]|nr:hypothetical protein [Holosporales bacterium]
MSRIPKGKLEHRHRQARRNVIRMLVLLVMLKTGSTEPRASLEEPVNEDQAPVTGRYIAIPTMVIVPITQPPSEIVPVRPTVLVVSSTEAGLKVGGTIPGTPTHQGTESPIHFTDQEEEVWQSWAKNIWWDFSPITPACLLGSGASEAILNEWADWEDAGLDVRDIFGSQDDGTREALIEMMDQQSISYKPEDIVNSLDAYVTGMKNKIERYRALIKVTGVAAAGV